MKFNKLEIILLGLGITCSLAGPYVTTWLYPVGVTLGYLAGRYGYNRR